MSANLRKRCTDGGVAMSELSGVVGETPRWTLYLHASSSGLTLVRYVNLGVGFLTPGLQEDLGDMIERGQEWRFGNLEGEGGPVQTSDMMRYRADSDTVCSYQIDLYPEQETC